MATARWLILPGFLMVVAAVACATPAPANQAEDDPSADPAPATTDNSTPSTTTPTTTSNTCLGKVNLHYPVAACDTCMNQADCCAKTITCFSTNLECKALQDCMVGCGAPAGSGTGTGGGTGDGGGGGGGGGGGTPAKMNFAQIVYPDLNGTCGGCHSAGGPGPQFFGGDPNSSYTLFKSNGFDSPASILLTKGAHEGPALTATQKTEIMNWQSLEATGATTTTDAGTTTPPADAAPPVSIADCRAACQTQHQAALQAWTDYDVCVTATCGTSCL